MIPGIFNSPEKKEKGLTLCFKKELYLISGILDMYYLESGGKVKTKMRYPYRVNFLDWGSSSGPQDKLMRNIVLWEPTYLSLGLK